MASYEDYFTAERLPIESIVRTGIDRHGLTDPDAIRKAARLWYEQHVTGGTPFKPIGRLWEIYAIARTLQRRKHDPEKVEALLAERRKLQAAVLLLRTRLARERRELQRQTRVLYLLLGGGCLAAAAAAMSALARM